MSPLYQDMRVRSLDRPPPDGRERRGRHRLGDRDLLPTLGQASAASHAACATCRPRSRRTPGPSSRHASPPPTRRPLARLFVDEHRRLTIIPNGFGGKRIFKFMLGVMIRAAEHWRAIRVSELERCQIRAVREELNREYEGPNGLSATTSVLTSYEKFQALLELDHATMLVSPFLTEILPWRSAPIFSL